MAVITQCASCLAEVPVPESLLGKSVKCRQCGTFFTAVDLDPEPGLTDPESDLPATYDENYPGFRRDAPPHRGRVVLLTGILSILLSIVFSPLGLVLGVTAWWLGARDLHLMETNRLDPRGMRMTEDGKVCGIIGTLVNLLCTSLLAVIAWWWIG